jgi:hypothetical protein
MRGIEAGEATTEPAKVFGYWLSSSDSRKGK